jgi:Holliday junction resolvase
MKGSKWESDLCVMLNDLGYSYFRVMAQYQEQPCDVVITGRDGVAFLPIYVECKSTKHDKLALSRNKRLREQYLAFERMVQGRGFYAVRFGDGTIDCYLPPFRSLTLHKTEGTDPSIALYLLTSTPHNNPLYVPQERTMMQEPEDRTL